MKCPDCGSEKSSVIDSRATDGAMGIRMIRRRRLCLTCDERFTTYEINSDAFVALGEVQLLLYRLKAISEHYADELGDLIESQNAGAHLVTRLQSGAERLVEKGVDDDG